MAPSNKPLDGLVVADLGVGMAPAVIACFLADNGARVVRVEPPEGDPYYARLPAYEVWRRSAEPLPEAASDPAVLADLLGRADVCLIGGEDHPQVTTRHDADAIARANTKLVVLEISGNPKSTLWDDRPAAEVLVQARTGLCFENSTTSPVYMALSPANMGAALQGLSGVLGALIERRRSGQGQIVRTSLFEGALTWVSLWWTQYEKPTPLALLRNPREAVPLIFKCSDGVFVHLVMGARNNKWSTYQALGIDDPTVKPGDAGAPDFNAPPRHFFGDIEVLGAAFAKISSTDAVQRLSSLGVPIEICAAPGDCWNTEQARVNGFVATEADGTRRIGNPLILKPSPAAGGDLPAVGTAPLEGLRALDFGAYVAGPLASVMLADLGADVIKVENPQGDPTRLTVRGFSAANRGKRGLVLDLKSEAGGRILKRLLGAADLVSSNFRPGAAQRLGIDPDAVHAIKPEMIVLESPAFGSEGPLADRGGFDPMIQACCGHELCVADGVLEPFWDRTFMVDYSGGLLGGIGMLLGLYQRAVTGKGMTVTSPLFNAGAFWLCELVQRPDGSWAGRPKVNSERTGRQPSEAFYQARDGWVAVVARGEAAGRGMGLALGVADRLGASVDAWGEAEAAAIQQAVATRSVDEVVDQLRAVGVWADPCRPDMEGVILNDPELLARGTVRASIHTEMGEIREIGPLFSLSRSRTGSTHSFPATIGEHTPEILAELTGQHSQVADLRMTAR